jgi:hypothetical protein
MKKILCILILILIPNMVFAAYNVEYTCSDDVCIEGDTVTFDVTLTTDSFYRDDITIESIEYTKISIKDKQYDTIIARKATNLQMESYDTKSVKLSGTIPPPTKGHDLYYVPCFDIKMDYYYYGSYTYDKYDKTETISMCGDDTLTMKVYPLSEIECRNTGNCKEDEHCVDFKCTQIICEDNQGYEDHTCKDLKCMFFQTAKNHKCELNYLIVGVGIIVIFTVVGLIIYFSRKKKTRPHKK